MSPLFLIWSYGPRRKEQESATKDWIIEKMHPYLKKIPYFKSVRTYGRRIGLGQVPIFQTWIEIPDFSALDEWVANIKSDEWKGISKELYGLTEGFNSAIVYEIT